MSSLFLGVSFDNGYDTWEELFSHILKFCTNLDVLVLADSMQPPPSLIRDAFPPTLRVLSIYGVEAWVLEFALVAMATTGSLEKVYLGTTGRMDPGKLARLEAAGTAAGVEVAEREQGWWGRPEDYVVAMVGASSLSPLYFILWIQNGLSRS